MSKTTTLDNEYPVDATVLTNSSGNVAAATATATLTAPAGKTAYIKGFIISGAGATAGAAVIVTITGVVGGTMSFIYTAATGVAVANTPLQVNFPFAIPATGIATNIVVSCPTLGAGNTNNAAVVFGYAK